MKKEILKLALLSFVIASISVSCGSDDDLAINDKNTLEVNGKQLVKIQQGDSKVTLEYNSSGQICEANGTYSYEKSRPSKDRAGDIKLLYQKAKKVLFGFCIAGNTGFGMQEIGRV